MSYKINYNLKGGSGNANIIWNNNDDIVLNNKIANQLTQRLGITYEYYKCNKSLDPFKCTKLDGTNDHKVDIWAHDDSVDLSWLNYGHSGFTNQGNTCFCNAYLQCILFTYPLIYHIKLSKPSSPDAFYNLVDKKFSNSNTPINIDRTELFLPTGSLQHDLHEYLTYFIDKMIVEHGNNYSTNNLILSKNILDRFKIKPDKNDGTENVHNLIDRDLNLNTNQYYNVSLFQYYFTFIVTSTLGTKNIINDIISLSTKTEIYNMLSVEIYQNSLGSCLNNFFKKEQIIDDERKTLELNIENDNKQIQILNLPEILIIHLKRLKYNQSGRIINDDIVSIPDIIEADFIKQFMYTKDGETNDIAPYDLYAFAVHSGTVSGGHYYSYIKKPTFSNHTYNNTFKPGWYKANDSSFTKEDSDPITDKNKGYIYFYKKRNSSSEFNHNIGNKDITFKYN